MINLHLQVIDRGTHLLGATDHQISAIKGNAKMQTYTCGHVRVLTMKETKDNPPNMFSPRELWRLVVEINAKLAAEQPQQPKQSLWSQALPALAFAPLLWFAHDSPLLYLLLCVGFPVFIIACWFIGKCIRGIGAMFRGE